MIVLNRRMRWGRGGVIVVLSSNPNIWSGGCVGVVVNGLRCFEGTEVDGGHEREKLVRE